MQPIKKLKWKGFEVLTRALSSSDESHKGLHILLALVQCIKPCNVLVRSRDRVEQTNKIQSWRRRRFVWVLGGGWGNMNESWGIESNYIIEALVLVVHSQQQCSTFFVYCDAKNSNLAF